MAIPDFTPQEELLLKQVAVTQQNNGFMTSTQVNAIVASYGASFKSTPSVETVTIASGSATVTRRAQVSFAAFATEGGASTDDLDTIVTTGFSQGDLLVCFIAQTGRRINVTSAGNINAGGFVWVDTTNCLMLVYTGAAWVEMARYPKSTTISRTQAEYVVPTPPAPSMIYAYTSWAKCYYRNPATETLATGTIQITAAAGTNGAVAAVVDDGSGVLQTIGTATYSAATIPNAVAADLNAAINAGTATHGYSSTVLLDTCTVSAPVGTGANANTFLLDTTVAGGVTAVDVDFAGGVTASYANATLDFIYGFGDGMELIFTNIMPANTITLGAGGNIGASAQGVIAASASTRIIYDSTTSAWELAG